jgi:hypothetical protein
MKIILDKKDLINALEDYNDNDVVVIEVHDMVIGEDLYTFYVDSVDLDKRGWKEVRLCVVPNIVGDKVIENN